MKKQVIVGGSLGEAAARVADAWRRAERGERVEVEDNVTFVSWSALASHMTDKRYELLRRLHRHPAVSIRALARDLGRDFKRVHQDVKALEASDRPCRAGRRPVESGLRRDPRVDTAGRAGCMRAAREGRLAIGACQ